MKSTFLSTWHLHSSWHPGCRPESVALRGAVNRTKACQMDARVFAISKSVALSSRVPTSCLRKKNHSSKRLLSPFDMILSSWLIFGRLGCRLMITSLPISRWSFLAVPSWVVTASCWSRVGPNSFPTCISTVSLRWSKLSMSCWQGAASVE